MSKPHCPCEKRSDPSTERESKIFLANEGLGSAILDPAQFATYIGSEIRTAGRLVADAGLEKN